MQVLISSVLGGWKVDLKLNYDVTDQNNIKKLENIEHLLFWKKKTQHKHELELIHFDVLSIAAKLQD